MARVGLFSRRFIGFSNPLEISKKKSYRCSTKR